MSLGFRPFDRPASDAADEDPFDRFVTRSAPRGGPPEPPELPPSAPRRRIRWGRWLVRGLGAFIVLFVIAVLWLAVTAPLSRSLKPPTPPSVTLLAADGKTPIARKGAIIGTPVDVTKLPKHIPQAFMAIEDRRFYSHWGVSPRGVARAMWNNLRAGGMREGGSTITQQLAKNAFLTSDRTFGRKGRELLISFWLEAWLTKDEILSRYLSNVYFGDNVYGLNAAARHYFSRDAEDLSIAQAAMLAGLVKAPSRLAPTLNLSGARARQKLVVGAMVESGFLTKGEAADVGPARLKVERTRYVPSGTYFADWVLPKARDRSGEIANEITVTTTLDTRMQRAAERAVRRAGLRQAQAALVAMRPDGTVVAMVGGKSYRDSPFNRAVQAQRQPGSTFKLFVYLAALRTGMTPDSTVLDEPVTIGEWSPKNSDGRYSGEISLARAFAKSSNVAAARLTKQVGVSNVIRAARDLGVESPIADEASIALGTSTMSLLELTSAYAAVAQGSYPVRAHGLAEQDEASWLERLRGRTTVMGERERDGMRTLLQRSIASGTGTSAALSIPAFGKTGTTQDSRDALFVGYAGDLVAGVWVGNDDNSPNPGLAGGGIPARIWRDFMTEALGVTPPRAPEVEEDPVGNLIEGIGDDIEPVIDGPTDGVAAEIEGLGLNLRLGRDGSIQVAPGDRPRDGAPAPRSDQRRPPPEAIDEEEAPPPR
jgi:penicillin-binding protein 1A